MLDHGHFPFYKNQYFLFLGNILIFNEVIKNINEIISHVGHIAVTGILDIIEGLICLA